jgi:hypothetical protein
MILLSLRRTLKIYSNLDDTFRDVQTVITGGYCILPTVIANRLSGEITAG